MYSKDDDVVQLMKELYKLCLSDVLSLEALQMNSLEALQKRTKEIADARIEDSGAGFLHEACYNKNVTLEIVEHLLDLFPDAASTESECDDGWHDWYPLHSACQHKRCPRSVINLLMNKYSETAASSPTGWLPLRWTGSWISN